MIYSYFKDSASQQLKGIQNSHSGGGPLNEKWYIKGLGVKPRGGASPDKTLLKKRKRKKKKNFAGTQNKAL